jgi:hypothetical protein
MLTGLYDNRTVHTRKESYMYLSVLDLVAVMIALVVSVTLVITTAIANARLTRAVYAYRDAWLNS